MRVEGAVVREAIGGSVSRRVTLSFLISVQGPLHTRFDAIGKRPILQICDGTYLWTYPATADSNSFTKLAASEEICKPQFARWRDFTEYLVAASITGRDQSEFDGHPQECRSCRGRVRDAEAANAGSAIRRA